MKKRWGTFQQMMHGAISGILRSQVRVSFPGSPPFRCDPRDGKSWRLIQFLWYTALDPRGTMKPLPMIAHFVKPYWKRAALAMVLLAALVLMDLAIPRLIQRIIDQGIGQDDRGTVVGTALLMLFISLASMLLAVGNNTLSVHVGESVARDLRDALFARIQTFSFADLDEAKTGRLL
ncbi:MAG: ABC transporter transmembrane domain-containing protein, partial [Thermodesulfobacteriota bacterium]